MHFWFCFYCLSIVILLKATDEDDKESTNSQISYCIVDDNNICMNHTHFHIDQSGAVSCIKELDYVDLSIPSRINAGEFRLKIKAFDHGTPPLYSIVSLKIFVQVKGKLFLMVFFSSICTCEFSFILF